MDTDLSDRLIQAAFHFLSYRPRSSAEIRIFLLKKIRNNKDADTSVVDSILIRLTELGYVNDEQFVNWWIESRTSRSPKGTRLIRQELLQKGVDPTIIEECSQNRKDSLSVSSEVELARRSIQKKLRFWQHLPILEQKRKMYGFLSRRGFDSHIIVGVIDELVGKEYNMPQDRHK